MAASQESRVAIVTGATSGIGLELAKDLHARGWKVACVGRRKEAGEELVKSLGDDNALFFQTKLEDYQSQAAMYQGVYKAWGRIDAVCANAGIVDKSSLYIFGHRGKDADDLPPEPDLSCTDIDYKGVVYGTLLATHFMRLNKPNPGGKIIITGSIAAIFPHQTYPEYSGAKAAVNTFVRGMAPILKAKENIVINCIMPGIVQTPIIPPEMIAAVSAECLTPVSTILKAYQKYLEDAPETNGEIIECSAGEMFVYDQPEMGNSWITKRAVTVWEPLFKMSHGEDSQLPDAIA